MTKQESKLWIKVYTASLKEYHFSASHASNEADHAVKQYRASVAYFEE